METDSGVDQSKGVRAVTVHFSPGRYISTEFCQADSDSHTVDNDLQIYNQHNNRPVYDIHVTQSNCLRSFDQYVLPKTIYQYSINKDIYVSIVFIQYCPSKKVDFPLKSQLKHSLL